MLILEGSQIVDILVDNDVQIVLLVVGSHIGCAECLGHDGCGRIGMSDTRAMAMRKLQTKTTKLLAARNISQQQQSVAAGQTVQPSAGGENPRFHMFTCRSASRLAVTGHVSVAFPGLDSNEV